MELYGKLLNIAVPFFLFFFIIEKIVEWKKGLHLIRGLDSVSSFSSGITNVVKDVLGVGVTIITYSWLVNKIAIFHIEATVLTYIVAFLVIDFQGYWVHAVMRRSDNYMFQKSHLADQLRMIPILQKKMKRGDNGNYFLRYTKYCGGNKQEGKKVYEI